MLHRDVTILRPEMIVRPRAPNLARDLIIIPRRAQITLNIKDAAGAWAFYDAFHKTIADATFDLDTNTSLFYMALVTSTSNAGTLTNSVYADLTNELTTANGYTLGGFNLTGVTFTRSGATATFTSAAATWTASGGSIVARRAVIYYNATVNTIIKPLVCTCLLDSTPADVTVTTGNQLSVTPNASGIFTITG